MGDGVEDALAVDDKIVFTYFDEGVFGGVPPSEQGLCVFTAGGRLEFGYQSGVRDPVNVADCYCACVSGRHEVCFSPYTGFPLVRLNLKTKRQEVYQLPQTLAGASAMTTDGSAFYFYGPYEHKNSILRWKHGDAVLEVGTHPGPLRGQAFAAFLSIGKSGYTTVSVQPA